MYQPLPRETPEEALARCYSLLLQSRNEEYRRWADVTVSYEERRAPGFEIEQFLERIGVERP